MARRHRRHRRRRPAQISLRLERGYLRSPPCACHRRCRDRCYSHRLDTSAPQPPSAEGGVPGGSQERPCWSHRLEPRYPRETEGPVRKGLTGDIFRIRSCATTSRSRSFVTFLRNSATSPGCSTSSCSAASMTASMQLLQEQRAGIPGATAALTPVPMTSSSSCGCFRMRLFRNFLLETTDGETRGQHRKSRSHKGKRCLGISVKCEAEHGPTPLPCPAPHHRMIKSARYSLPRISLTCSILIP